MHRPQRRTRTTRTTSRRPAFDPLAEQDGYRRDRLITEAQLRSRPY